jgi:hypothetical protein
MVVRALEAGGGAGGGGAALAPGTPNIIVWFFAAGGAVGAAAGLPNIIVLLPGAEAALAGTGAGSAGANLAVNTCPHRVHWTGAPCGGISASSRT